MTELERRSRKVLCKGQASRTEDDSMAAPPARDAAPQYLGKS